MCLLTGNLSQDSPCWRRTSASGFFFLPLGSHTAHTWRIWLQEARRTVSVWLWQRSAGTFSTVPSVFNSRFCSGEKFLLGFRDLFFCLFLDNVSAAASDSSNALFWQTVLFTSGVWLFPLATGSFGLHVTNTDQFSDHLAWVGRSCYSSLSGWLWLQSCRGKKK